MYDMQQANRVMLHSDDPDSFVHQNVINSLHLRWCPDGEFSAMDFFASCISSEPRAAHFRPAF